jgi:hypothetical protein
MFSDFNLREVIFNLVLFGKMGAMRPPSAKPLIPQGEWQSINSDGGARRDSLSL